MKAMDTDDDLFTLRSKRDEIFNVALDKIKVSVKHIYGMLTQGGMADIECESEGDPFEAGLR